MNKLIFLITFPVIIFSCKAHKKETPAAPPVENGADTAAGFFPLTIYLKGQLAEIRQIGINPLKIVTKNGKADSSWLKIDELETNVAPFLTPEIDTANLKGLFSQKNFMDQTLDAVTFTYDSLKTLPIGFQLKHWDVYVSPQTNRVTRIYMVKEPDNNTRQLLTWQTDGSWCKIVTIKHTGNDNPRVESEAMITWKF
jgi:hypothetical protein